MASHRTLAIVFAAIGVADMAWLNCGLVPGLLLHESSTAAPASPGSGSEAEPHSSESSSVDVIDADAQAALASKAPSPPPAARALTAADRGLSGPDHANDRSAAARDELELEPAHAPGPPPQPQQRKSPTTAAAAAAAAPTTHTTDAASVAPSTAAAPLTLGGPGPHARIYFKQKMSAQLDAEALITLEALAQHLIDHRDDRVRLAAHADSRGPAAYNRKLSRRRARAARRRLIELGVQHWRAYGHNRVTTKPPDDSQAGDDGDKLAAARRVDFFIERKSDHGN